MDAEKNKKLQQYSSILVDQAKEAERSGRNEDAMKHYLKLVDVFLVLASEAQDHNTWQTYIRQAEEYQSRIRSLVPADQVGGTTPSAMSSGRIAPAVDKFDASTSMQRSGSVITRPSFESNQTNVQGNQNQPKSGAFSKILKPFQKADGSPDQTQASALNTSYAPPGRQPSTSSGSQKLQSTTLQSQSGQNSTRLSPTPSEEKSPVPHELYDRLMSENKILQEKLQAIIKERDEKVAYFESKSKELGERISTMIPRSDYDALRADYENMIPRQEYDRIKTELANTVPISHYDLLLDRISNMVPREVYVAAERRALELEDNLRHSVPSDVIEDLADEISLLNIAAEVPPILDGVARKERVGKDERSEEQITVRADEQPSPS